MHDFTKAHPKGETVGMYEQNVKATLATKLGLAQDEEAPVAIPRRLSVCVHGVKHRCRVLECSSDSEDVPAPFYTCKKSGIELHYVEFIGKTIGVAGSNVIVTNERHREKNKPHPQVHRFGTDGRLRQTHSYTRGVGDGTSTQHWVLANHQNVTHYWPCDAGYTGGAPRGFVTTNVSTRGEHCLPCEVAYFSDDGWLDDCDLCPTNRTTYHEAQTECKPVVRPVFEGLSWEDTRTIIITIGSSIVGTWLLLVACQYACYRGRKKRVFTKVNYV